jgi:hypothetical protein
VIVAATYWSIVAAILLTVPLALANAAVNAYMGARGIGLDLDTLRQVVGRREDHTYGRHGAPWNGSKSGVRK